MRSELDKLSDPLKKLVVQHVSARQWLEAAVFDVDFPSDNVSPADKTMFIKKVIRFVYPLTRCWHMYWQS